MPRTVYTKRKEKTIANKESKDKELKALKEFDYSLLLKPKIKYDCNVNNYTFQL